MPPTKIMGYKLTNTRNKKSMMNFAGLQILRPASELLETFSLLYEYVPKDLAPPCCSQVEKGACFRNKIGVTHCKMFGDNLAKDCI